VTFFTEKIEADGTVSKRVIKYARLAAKQEAHYLKRVSDYQVQEIVTNVVNCLGFVTKTETGRLSRIERGSCDPTSEKDFCDPKSDGIYIVMEQADYSLDHITFETKDVIDVQNRIGIASDLINAVDFLHGTIRLAHCDLKDDNILLTIGPNGKFIARVCDLGSSNWTTACKTTRPACSPNWSSPEHFMYHPCLEALDLWSLGVVFSHLWYYSKQHGPPTPLFVGADERSVFGAIIKMFGYEAIMKNKNFANLPNFGQCKTMASGMEGVKPSGLIRKYNGIYPDIPFLFRTLIHRLLNVDPAGRPGARHMKEIVDIYHKWEAEIETLKTRCELTSKVLRLGNAELKVLGKLLQEPNETKNQVSIQQSMKELDQFTPPVLKRLIGFYEFQVSDQIPVDPRAKYEYIREILQKLRTHNNTLAAEMKKKQRAVIDGSPELVAVAKMGWGMGFTPKA